MPVYVSKAGGVGLANVLTVEDLDSSWITGALAIDTGSFIVSASFANPFVTFSFGDGSQQFVDLVTLIPTNAVTASYVTGSSVYGPFGSNSVISASYAVTASHALNVSVPGGNDTEIQFNSASTFEGNPSFTFIYSSQSLQQGENVIASGKFSHAEGVETRAIGNYSHAEGRNTEAQGIGSHAEGRDTAIRSAGNYSHAEGFNTTVYNAYSHVEGRGTETRADYSHAEGYNTTTLGMYAHAEGSSSIARGEASHAEGFLTIASSSFSHAEGSLTQAIGVGSHAEGGGSKDITRAIGNYSHAEGTGTQAIGVGSHAEGLGTIASGPFQHAQGQYNLSSSADSAFIIGNGRDDSTRSNLVFASGGHFEVTGSLRVTGSAFIVGLDNTAQSNVITLNTTTGQLFYTASSAIGGGGGGTPGGSDTQIQFNNAGAFGGVPTLTYNGSLLSATGSFTGSFTGSLLGSSSYALTASFIDGGTF